MYDGYCVHDCTSILHVKSSYAFPGGMHLLHNPVDGSPPACEKNASSRPGVPSVARRRAGLSPDLRVLVLVRSCTHARSPSKSHS